MAAGIDFACGFAIWVSFKNRVVCLCNCYLVLGCCPRPVCSGCYDLCAAISLLVLRLNIVETQPKSTSSCRAQKAALTTEAMSCITDMFVVQLTYINPPPSCSGRDIFRWRIYCANDAVVEQ